MGDQMTFSNRKSLIVQMVTSCSFHGGRVDMGIRFKQRLLRSEALLALEGEPMGTCNLLSERCGLMNKTINVYLLVLLIECSLRQTLAFYESLLQYAGKYLLNRRFEDIYVHVKLRKFARL